MSRCRKLLLTGLVLAVYALHQDSWNWTRSHPLVLGILPAGLAYHVAYTLAAAVTMALLVKFAWPGHLERAAAEAPNPQTPAKPSEQG